ncbi:hypothetical protein ACFOZ1_09840 [Gracilibacillus marinus]|uniref:Uncharacterized protein n=1 Tax=Gracilibacillus marinus TaxID=630535 RepID=A0ABV8VZ75_9BACI
MRKLIIFLWLSILIAIPLHPSITSIHDGTHYPISFTLDLHDTDTSSTELQVGTDKFIVASGIFILIMFYALRFYRSIDFLQQIITQLTARFYQSNYLISSTSN